MFCKNCGKEIADESSFCPHCGKLMSDAPAETPSENGDRGGFGWGLLGFLIPIAGLILYLVWRDEKPKNARAVGIGALVSVCLSVAVYILVYALFAVIGFACIA